MLLLPVSNPPNPWASAEVEYFEEVPAARLEVFEDHTREILASNDSPDVGFRFSANPYRGCFHGCAYCYARPTHEYLGFGAGTDFDRKITVKPRAPELLRAAFERRSWKRERVVFSGVTDCYQPLEASYRLTRRCLEVCVEYANPIGIITKAPLVERDIDVLKALAVKADVWVNVSIPLWDRDKARAIEPYVATPERRMRTIEALAAVGIRVGVNVAPMIPGLSDEDIPAILTEAKARGASYAGFVFLRLPGSVKQVFAERLREKLPLRADRVLSLVMDAREGKLYDSRFQVRQQGSGPYAQSVRALFEQVARRLGLETDAAAGAGQTAESETEVDPVVEDAPVRARAREKARAASAQLELFGVERK